ncbi:MAG: RHS repeat-associated core domain-containing protein [Planctomycetota bacterium]
MQELSIRQKTGGENYEGKAAGAFSFGKVKKIRRLSHIISDIKSSIGYSYDIGNRLKRLTNTVAGGETADFNYADYDKVDNRLSMKQGDANTQGHYYDNLYQLIYVDYNDGNTTNYYYDALGNRTQVTNGSEITYESNKLNQYVEVNNVNFIYDKNGNLTYDGREGYIYDCENRLTGLMTGHNVSYKYDFAGRRVLKSRFNPQPPTVTKYTYDGEQIIADYNDTNVLQRKYVYGPEIDEPICMIDVQNGNAIYYYHYDGLGSVVALSDVNAQIVETYSYDVFGKPEIRNTNDEILTTSSYGNRFMFTGREYDSETGNYYYRARYYSPTLGRFLQTDPIGYAGGLNLYTYCGNNPLNWIDPWGLFRFGRRDLKGSLPYSRYYITPLFIFGDMLNVRYYHEAGFYQDGSGDYATYGTVSEHYDDGYDLSPLVTISKRII